MTPEIKARVDAVIERCLHVLNAKHRVNIPKPAVHYDLRGLTAGRAISWFSDRPGYIRLNIELLHTELEKMLERTVPHEVCHIAASFIYRRKIGHGPEWRRLMQDLGCTDITRCHDYDVTPTKIKKIVRYVYLCGCPGGVPVGPKHHKQIQAGRTGIYCKKCRRTITRSTPIESVNTSDRRGLTVPNSTPMYPHQSNPTQKMEQILSTATGTKMEQCYALYSATRQITNHIDRSSMISRFVNTLGMTPAGASTYFYNCVKKFEGK